MYCSSNKSFYNAHQAGQEDAGLRSMKVALPVCEWPGVVGLVANVQPTGLSSAISLLASTSPKSNESSNYGDSPSELETSNSSTQKSSPESKTDLRVTSLRRPQGPKTSTSKYLVYTLFPSMIYMPRRRLGCAFGASSNRLLLVDDRSRFAAWRSRSALVSPESS